MDLIATFNKYMMFFSGVLILAWVLNQYITRYLNKRHQKELEEQAPAPRIMHHEWKQDCYTCGETITWNGPKILIENQLDLPKKGSNNMYWPPNTALFCSWECAAEHCQVGGVDVNQSQKSKSGG